MQQAAMLFFVELCCIMHFKQCNAAMQQQILAKGSMQQSTAIICHYHNLIVPDGEHHKIFCTISRCLHEFFKGNVSTFQLIFDELLFGQHFINIRTISTKVVTKSNNGELLIGRQIFELNSFHDIIINGSAN